MVKIWQNGECSTLAGSDSPGLYPKSSPVKYSYLFNVSDGNAEIVSVHLSKLYWASFSLILLWRVLIFSFNIMPIILQKYLA